MYPSFSILSTLLFITVAFSLPCDVESDACRAVINASACFNEFMSGSNKNSVLNCLTGTEGAQTPTQKVCNSYGESTGRERDARAVAVAEIAVDADVAMLDVRLYGMRGACYDDLVGEE